ncbi:relaxase/mobilization nuclease domain-containing protein [Streptomyces sp. NPDC018321]|uniref:relaxase/mobilization nuclease domain-containing protein n=1 Tax=unclassified Streptomyces TaxID=2593676 RepID=UPI00378B9297
MPKKAREGNDTSGLLHYLYGPGKRDEHVDPRMVAAWDPFVEDPARSSGMTISDLALLLDAPVHALLGRKPTKHVYHVAVRNPPEDRELSDQEWARVARELMAAAGIDPHGDEQGCRWLAVRHAADHIHIVATAARQDGRQPNLRQDIVRMHDVARRFEAEFGLRRLTHGDKTPRKWSKTGEAEKATRRGLPETARETLQRAVREAAAAAADDSDFFARIGAAGVRVQRRIAQDGSVTGYSVALPGDRDGRQEPVWFSGSRLAPDLSLPRARERWALPVAGGALTSAEAWRVAEGKVRQAGAHLGAGGLQQGAGDVAALGDLAVVVAQVSPRVVRELIRDAAREFERASRAPAARSLEGRARELYRDSASTLSRSIAGAGRSDTRAVLGLLAALVLAVDASRRWHEAQEFQVQAHAAGRAGRLLREAVEVTAGVAAARRSRPRQERAPVRPRAAQRTATVPGVRPMAEIVQEAVPSHARTVLADPAWPALRARLGEVGCVGEDPVEVLSAVAAQRELSSAQSVAEVLAWRLDGWRKHRGPGAAAADGPSSAPTTVTAATGADRAGPLRQTGAHAPTRHTPADVQGQGPKLTR